jgi:perosamine synthetase
MISLATADIPIKAWLNLSKCLLTKRIGRGDFVKEFEENMADYFGAKYAIATCNGTMADTVMLMTLHEMYPDKDQVILPAFTFVAHSNSVVNAGLKPIFVDIGENYQIDWKQVIPTDKTLCVFPANLLGKSCQIPSWPEIPILEDCCESMGGSTFCRMFGTEGIAGSFSMFPSHTITTGEGGLIITNNSEFNEIARSVMNHGKFRTNDFTFSYFGTNAKMTNLQAAVGCSLVEKIDEVNKKRRRNVELYNHLLGLNFYAEAPHCYPILYPSKNSRDSALKLLGYNGIEARKLMGCIPEYEFYQKRFGDMGYFPHASLVANTGLFVPVHQNLSQKDIKKICVVLNATRQ